MVFLNDSLVYRVIVIKCDRSKASVVATASVSHDSNHFHFIMLFKLIPQMMFFIVFFKATDTNLLHS